MMKTVPPSGHKPWHLYHPCCFYFAVTSCMAAESGITGRQYYNMPAFVAYNGNSIGYHLNNERSAQHEHHVVFERKRTRQIQIRKKTSLSLQQLPMNSNNDEDAILNNNNDNGGMYLDEETYLKAEETMLRSDGSLTLDSAQENKQSNSYPRLPKIKNKAYQTAVEGLFSPPPSYSYTSEGESDTNEDSTSSNRLLSKSQQQLSDEELLYQTVQAIQNPTNDND